MVACLLIVVAAVLGIGKGYGNWFDLDVSPIDNPSFTKSNDTTNENSLNPGTTNVLPSVSTTTPATTFPATFLPTIKTTIPSSQQTNPTSTTSHELNYELDWDLRSMPGKYRTIIVDNREYVYPFNLGEYNSTTRKPSKYILGLDIEGVEPDGTKHLTSVDIFTLEGFDKKLALGVKFENDERIYAYVNVSYIPDNLGEFLNAVDYRSSITYGNIELHSGARFPVNSENADDIKNYLLSDVSAKNNQNANPTGYSVTLSISCSELGFNNKAFYIYENGYIATNLIGSKYIFFVGTENVNNFLKNSYNTTFAELKAVNNNSASSKIAVDATTSYSKPLILE